MLQAVADAVVEAQEEELPLDAILSLVAIAVIEYGRVAFEDDYIEHLCQTIRMRQGKPLPNSNIEFRH